MNTPREAVDKKEQLTADYITLNEKLKVISRRKPMVWMEMRKLAKNGKETDMAWYASDMGMEEVEIKLSMKAIEKEISSLNSYLKNAENEARNLY